MFTLLSPIKWEAARLPSGYTQYARDTNIIAVFIQFVKEKEKNIAEATADCKSLTNPIGDKKEKRTVLPTLKSKISSPKILI